MATEEKLTITERAADGTETTIEITARTVVPDEVEEKGLLERVVDAIFDRDTDEPEDATAGSQTVIGVDPSTTAPTTQVEMHVSHAIDQETVHAIPVIVDGGFAAEPEVPEVASALPGADAGTESGLASADAARDAQAAADAFAAQGDYRAAAEAREVAEQASWDAGDRSMLGVYDAQDLAHAAERQDQAREYRDQQADLIEKGDYEGAREAALNAGYATRDADSSAGGADHSGQSGRDVANLDWATWQEKQAQENAQHAQTYAAEGDVEKAEMYAERAGEQQASAHGYAERAGPNSIMQDHDPSSVVDTGGSYDAALASVDTGFEAPMDVAASSYDSTTDDVV